MTSPAPVRPCHVCGNYDDHPRHVYTQPDGTDSIRHMDCCQEAGCPDGTCAKVTKGAKDAKGDDLRKHLTRGGKANG